MYYSVYNLIHIEEKLSMPMLFYNDNIQRWNGTFLIFFR